MGEAATIDTAPRDGTHILGKDGFWREMWLVRDQYEGEFWRDEFDSEPEPTHWAPLPATSPRSDDGSGLTPSKHGFSAALRAQEKDGRAIAMSVDPNTSNDVCSFCRHSKVLGFMSIECTLGHTPYFRSLSNVGMIFVSDCGAGELKPELQAFDEPRGLSAADEPCSEGVTPNPPEVS